MGEIVSIEDRFYIHVDSALTDRRTLVLKEGDAFGVFGTTADIESVIHSAQGLYRDDTRFLSRLELRVEGKRPLLLGSDVTRDNARVVADYTNPDLTEQDGVALSRGTLHISRSRLLWRGVMHERLTVANFSMRPVRAQLTVGFAADYADVFEVRGTGRVRRGRDLEPELTRGSVGLGYTGLDGITRRTVIRFTPEPEELTRRDARFVLSLEPRERIAIHLAVACEVGDMSPTDSFVSARADLKAHIARFTEAQCRIESSNEHLAEWTDRSLADIRSLLVRTPYGAYPHAGIPWYSCPFGRDGIITALQTLWIDPSIARGVLAYLAAMQAGSLEPERDAEPGKILHERRIDEMANTGEVPFSRYYGTVDATPLFVVLAGEYYRATGDHATAEVLWPNVVRAMEWIDRYGDQDGDGLVEYQVKAELGLVNQGWKDSHDSISHADGTLAEGPIALCEVQGYVYQARRAAAELARALDMTDEAERHDAEANRLRARFTGAFWLPHLGVYALALDGKKRPCAVRSSNAGHALFSGIALPDHARRIARTLLGREMFSGWGVRTLASGEARYDPMSYHNGSVWPHDNALIAAGFARYGLRKASRRITESWFNASTFLELHRLPELFCGFARRAGKGPTPYPVACSPQAWAAGAAFMLLSACLGMSVDGVNGHLRIRRPALPTSIRSLTIRGVRIGDSAADLYFHQQGGDVGVLVLGKDGPARVTVVK